MGLMPESRELEADIEKAARVADGLAEAVGRGPRHATAAARRLTDEELTLWRIHDRSDQANHRRFAEAN